VPIAKKVAVPLQTSTPKPQDARETMIRNCVALFDQALAHIDESSAPLSVSILSNITGIGTSRGDVDPTGQQQKQQPSILSSFHCTTADGRRLVEMNVFLGRRLAALDVDLIGRSDGLIVHAGKSSQDAATSLLQKGDRLTEVGMPHSPLSLFFSPSSPACLAA